MNLTVFFGSLEGFDKSGILDRELARYRYYQERGDRVNLVVYGRGDAEAQAYERRLEGLRILYNKLNLPARQYLRRLHQVHARQLLGSHLIMNHNSSGIPMALRSHWAWKVPLVVIIDYISSEVAKIQHAYNPKIAREIADLERQSLLRAQHVIVTTDQIADRMIERVPEARPKLTVIPNYVDSELFRPLALEKRYDLVYVGQMIEVKNLERLLEAVERLGLRIAMIGGANEFSKPEDRRDRYFEKLKARFGDLNGRVDWLGRVKNEEMPAYLNQAKAFILPSLSEGHPRALIEAQACGLPCIGSNRPGINSVLQHEVTGILCETDADSIAQAIASLLSQPLLMQEIGANARHYVLEHYSPERIFERENNLLRQVMDHNPVGGASRRVVDYLFRTRM